MVVVYLLELVVGCVCVGESVVWFGFWFVCFGLGFGWWFL